MGRPESRPYSQGIEAERLLLVAERVGVTGARALVGGAVGQAQREQGPQGHAGDERDQEFGDSTTPSVPEVSLYGTSFIGKPRAYASA